MDYMLSTIDNPFSPFTDYQAWNQWDMAAGYYSAGLLGRIAITSHDLSDADQKIAIEKAIDEIVEENVLGVFIKVDADYIPLQGTKEPAPS